MFKFTKPFCGDQVDYTDEDTYCRTCAIDNEVAVIDVANTVGQEEYSYAARIRQLGTDVAGYMLVYSVTSRRSFEEITIYYHEILREWDKDYFPMLIVGNQCFEESLREVTTQEGERLARELGCTFFEVDDKSCHEVDAAFFDLVREARRYRRNLLEYR